MLIVGRQRLFDFAGAHADARSWIENWIADTEQALWRTPQDIKSVYAAASFLGDNVVVFNVKGNHYRLEVQVMFKTQIVIIRWAGTHAAYSKRVH